MGENTARNTLDYFFDSIQIIICDEKEECVKKV